MNPPASYRQLRHGCIPFQVVPPRRPRCRCARYCGVLPPPKDMLAVGVEVVNCRSAAWEVPSYDKAADRQCSESLVTYYRFLQLNTLDRLAGGPIDLYGMSPTIKDGHPAVGRDRHVKRNPHFSGAVSRWAYDICSHGRRVEHEYSASAPPNVHHPNHSISRLDHSNDGRDAIGNLPAFGTPHFPHSEPVGWGRLCEGALGKADHQPQHGGKQRSGQSILHHLLSE